MKQAAEPFRFVNAFYLLVVGLESAHTLRELGNRLATVSQNSIFCHTFHSLATHHYTSYSSDFAQWAMAACNESELAERLGAIDVRQFVDLNNLRSALIHAVDTHVRANPASGDRPAFEPFFFSETREIVLPTEIRASNLGALADGIRHMSLFSLHYHFVNSRLRLHLRTNDFSHWIDRELELPDLAAQVNSVDFYTNTLPEVREGILRRIEPWITQ